jgi:Glycosyl transferases group 1
MDSQSVKPYASPQHTVDPSHADRRPRVCMPTARRFARRAFQCGLYEAQDVLCEADDIALIELETRRGFHYKQHWQRRLLYRDVSRRLIFANPGLKRVRLTQNYDLFVAVCQNYWDLLCINAIDNWKDRCKTSVIWIEELWAALIPHYKYWLHALAKFDHIFVGYSGSAGPLSHALGRQCHWLTGGVDTKRFSPYPNPPPRTVDIYSIGRRHTGIHDALLRLAETRQMFYVYDTFSGADTQPVDHRQHREMLANFAKRSRYFIVAPAKIDAPHETHGQIELGYRYYEGCAAGAVMIGQPAPCESFRRLFDWPDSVISVRPDGSDTIDVLSSLSSRPERLEEISHRNAIQALLRHDWIYRWKNIYAVAGIEPSPGMVARERSLRAIVAAASDGPPRRRATFERRQ